MTVPSQPEPNTRDLRPLRTTQKSSNLRKTPRTRTPHDDDPNHAGPLGTEGSTETRVHAAPTTKGRNNEKDRTMIGLIWLLSYYEHLCLPRGLALVSYLLPLNLQICPLWDFLGVRIYQNLERLSPSLSC